MFALSTLEFSKSQLDCGLLATYRHCIDVPYMSGEQPATVIDAAQPLLGIYWVTEHFPCNFVMI
jgi:hypothetical protein